MASKGTDIVSIDGEIQTSDVLAYYQDPTTTVIGSIKEDPDVVARRIMQRTLDAESPEAVFGEVTVLHAKDVVGQPLQFRRVEWRASDFEEGEGLPFFAVCEVADAEGTIQPMTVGAKSIMVKLAKAAAEGWLPLWLKITKAEKPTTGGYYPLDISSVDAPVAAGTSEAF
jgi:hypothetical protein